MNNKYLDHQFVARLTLVRGWIEYLSAKVTDRWAYMVIILNLLAAYFSSRLKIIKPCKTTSIIRDKLSKFLKKQPFNQNLRDCFRNYRNRLTELLQFVNREYYRNILKHSSNPWILWETLNELGGKCWERKFFLWKDDWRIDLNSPQYL